VLDFKKSRPAEEHLEGRAMRKF